MLRQLLLPCGKLLGEKIEYPGRWYINTGFRNTHKDILSIFIEVLSKSVMTSDHDRKTN